jgi:DNA-binding NarL/FixJ family response regulator
MFATPFKDRYLDLRRLPILNVPQPAARILIANGHRLLSDACKGMLEPEFTVVGIVADGCALVSAAFTLKPDVIILDIGMPSLNGLDAGELIKREMPTTKLVFLSMNMNCDVVATAFRKGASAYVTKQSGAVELALAVRKVIRGESYLSPLIARETLMSLLSSKRVQKQISQRENEILHLLAEGRSIKQVADVLEIQPITVAFHRCTIMMRLNFKSNAELLGYAIKCRMMSSETASF